MESSTYIDPSNPDRPIARREVDRRERYLEILRDLVGPAHSVVQLVRDCLHNAPDVRPQAIDLLHRVQDIKVQVEQDGGTEHQRDRRGEARQQTIEQARTERLLQVCRITLKVLHFY